MTLTFNLARTKPKGSLYNKGVYPPEYNEDFKVYIRKRDGYKCALCSTKGDSLDVHHINYTKYTVKVNCISLCRECHNQVHQAAYDDYEERSFWKTKLYKISCEREQLVTRDDFDKAWRQPDAHNT